MFKFISLVRDLSSTTSVQWPQHRALNQEPSSQEFNEFKSSSTIVSYSSSACGSFRDLHITVGLRRVAPFPPTTMLTAVVKSEILWSTTKKTPTKQINQLNHKNCFHLTCDKGTPEWTHGLPDRSIHEHTWIINLTTKKNCHRLNSVSWMVYTMSNVLKSCVWNIHLFSILQYIPLPVTNPNIQKFCNL